MSEHPKDRYGDFVVPDFQCTIPSHLLDRLSDSDRNTVITVSTLDSKMHWVIELVTSRDKDFVALETKSDKAAELLNTTAADVKELKPIIKESQEKVAKLWDWHLMLSGKWAVLWAFLLVAVTAIVKVVMDSLTKKGP